MVLAIAGTATFRIKIDQYMRNKFQLERSINEGLKEQT